METHITCRCGLPHPHEHGPCRACAFYREHHPRYHHWTHWPICVHATMQEEHMGATGAYMVYGDPRVRNGDGLCPTFRTKGT